MGLLKYCPPSLLEDNFMPEGNIVSLCRWFTREEGHYWCGIGESNFSFFKYVLCKTSSINKIARRQPHLHNQSNFQGPLRYDIGFNIKQLLGAEGTLDSNLPTNARTAGVFYHGHYVRGDSNYKS